MIELYTKLIDSRLLFRIIPIESDDGGVGAGVIIGYADSESERVDVLGTKAECDTRFPQWISYIRLAESDVKRIL